MIVEEHDIFGDGVNIAARLEGLAAPGGICVSSRVRDHIGDRLPYAFDDIGEQTVKNIARPVRVYRVGFSEPVIVPSAEKHNAAVKTPLPLPDKPSIAVLPFSNMSSDPEHEFLADGIAEDMITALSRYPSLFVIARNSSFTYKGGAIDVKQVGRDLGVRYVLEGSLRRSGNRIRVTAQLVEAETGNHIWADRYDRDLANIFAVQDEITEAVTIAIAPAIAEAELRRAVRRPMGNLDAWAAYQRGLWHAFKIVGTMTLLHKSTSSRRSIATPPSPAATKASLWLTFSRRLCSRRAARLKRTGRPKRWPAGQSRLIPPMRKRIRPLRQRCCGTATMKAPWPRSK